MPNTLRSKDFTPGIPVRLCLRNLEPREAPDNGYGPAWRFDTDAGSIYIDNDRARDITERVRELGIQPNEPISLVKVKTSHGGHRWQLDRAEQQPTYATPVAATDAKLEAQLRGSIALAQKKRAGTFVENAPAPGTAAPATVQNNVKPAAAAEELSALSLKFMGAYKDAIDTLIEARKYAQRQGLALEVRCEDVRCLAATLIIEAGKNGARA